MTVFLWKITNSDSLVTLEILLRDDAAVLLDIAHQGICQHAIVEGLGPIPSNMAHRLGQLRPLHALSYLIDFIGGRINEDAPVIEKWSSSVPGWPRESHLPQPSVIAYLLRPAGEDAVQVFAHHVALLT